MCCWAVVGSQVATRVVPGAFSGCTSETFCLKHCMQDTTIIRHVLSHLTFIYNFFAWLACCARGHCASLQVCCLPIFHHIFIFVIHILIYHICLYMIQSRDPQTERVYNSVWKTAPTIHAWSFLYVMRRASKFQAWTFFRVCDGESTPKLHAAGFRLVQ